MPLFAVIYRYDPESSEARIRRLADHRDWLAETEKMGCLIGAGLFDDARGALLLIRAPQLDAVLEILVKDPYTLYGLVRARTVREWKPTWGLSSIVDADQGSRSNE